MKLKRILFAAFFLQCCAGIGATDAQPSAVVHQGFDLEVLHQPTPVSLQDRLALRYEISLTNFGSDPLALVKLEVLDARNGKVLQTLEENDLAKVTETIGVAAPGLAIDAGRTALVYLDLAVPADSAPTALEHRVTYIARELHSITGAHVEMSSSGSPVLGPPLHGTWAAVHDPSLARGHRRVVYAIGGKARIPGRYAIDWMSPGEDPQAGRGSDVLAVADARVVALRRGVPDVADISRRNTVQLSDAPGNYIVLDLGEGRFATYEHLEPELLVELGESVRRGQRIGTVGSSGQASRPHLHFHVADSSSPLEGESVPYILEGATVLGLYPDIRAAARGGTWQPDQPLELGPGSSHLPPPNSLVRFD